MALDPEKVLVYKRYLAKSAHRMIERDVARERIKQQLDVLRDMHPEEMKSKIDELERRIAATIQREGTLRQHHASEDIFHRELRDRMSMLEGRINKYLSTREERLVRITALEEKIAVRLSDKNEQIATLRMDIEHLEKIARELEEEPKGRKKLAKLQERIATIKKEISSKESTDPSPL